MNKDRTEQGSPVLEDSLNFAKSFLGRDLSKQEITGFIDLAEVYGAEEVNEKLRDINEKLRDIVGGIREEKKVAEYLDGLLEKKGLSLVDIVAIDFGYGDGTDFKRSRVIFIGPAS